MNDHTPTFDLAEYDLSLVENTPVNSKIFSLRATDEDSGENARLEYQIVSGDNTTFGIFPDGHLYLKMEVDREERDYYSLRIFVSDHGEPRRSSTTTMTIHITDKNDNSPELSSRHYQFSVNENEPANTFLGQVYATDLDIGRNAELTYSLEKSSQQMFSVHPKTGFIVSRTELDREMLIRDLGSDSVTLELLVSDNGQPSLTDTATLTITVLDENDNTPVFSKDTYVARISEAAEAGTEVKAVFASDDDLGDNGAVRYRITGGNRLRVFSINSTTGVITLSGSLDREEESEYVLSVEAEDGGTPALSASASVIVIVADENDNSPRITNTVLQLTIAEDAPVGEKVFTFHAEDDDQGENAELRYSISGGSYQKYFNIDQFTGTLVLQKSLDYERDKSFVLEVTVRDGGSPALEDTATLKVEVTDVNDNAPVFPSTAIVVQIQEGVAGNTAVVSMEAVDDDSGDNGEVEYSLAGYETGSAEKFTIDSRTGVISTLGDIDREEIDTYRFTVVATDQAVPVSSRQSAEKVITIIVEDINDNSPEFVSVPTGVVTPGSRSGDTIMTMLATDPDTNNNGQVTYRLEQDSYLFTIDHYSGQLSLKNTPETLETKYELTVIASDEAVQSERRSSSATVTILGITSDVKGAAFKQSRYEANIVENEEAGAFISSVELSEAVRAEFFITEVQSEAGRRNSNLFRIDPDTGDITTVKTIDREVQGSKFVISVTAIQVTVETMKTSSCQVRNFIV